jgi:hypothetical protein
MHAVRCSRVTQGVSCSSAGDLQHMQHTYHPPFLGCVVGALHRLLSADTGVQSAHASHNAVPLPCEHMLTQPARDRLYPCERCDCACAARHGAAWSSCASTWLTRATGPPYGWPHTHHQTLAWACQATSSQVGCCDTVCLTPCGIVPCGTVSRAACAHTHAVATPTSSPLWVTVPVVQPHTTVAPAHNLHRPRTVPPYV